MRSSTAAQFSQSYHKIADILRIEGRNAPKADVFRLVCDYLSEEQSGPWIMILDNADDQTLLSMDYARREGSTGQLRPLSSFLPQGSHGSILVTSRDRRVAEDLTGSLSSIIPVFALDEIDSIALLRERSKDTTSPDEDAGELVRILDNHALAIELAAGSISDGLPRTTISKYIGKYRKSLKNQLPEEIVPQAVSMTWQLSFESIRKRHPQSFKILSLMSMLHFDDMPDFLFTNYMPRYETNPALFEENIQPLLRISLIVPDGDNKFDMHRLVQHSTRSWLIANHEMHQRVREARSLIAQAFPDISAGHEDWKRCQTLLPHAEATLSLDVGPENERQRLQRGKMLFNIAYFQYIKGDHAAALRHFIDAKQVLSELLHENDDLYVYTGNMFYRLLSEMGQREEALHQINTELMGLDQRRPNSVYTLVLLEEKARIMLDHHHLEKAEKEAKQALQRMMTYEGDGVSEVHKLDAKRTLARAISLQGEPEQAEPMLREVLTRRKELCGLDHVDTLKSMLDLAQCLVTQERYKEGEEYFTEAERGFLKFPGNDATWAEKIQKMRQESRLASERHGFIQLQHKLHRIWRLTKLRIVGSPRTALTVASNKGHISRWWLYTLLLLVAPGLALLVLLTYSSKNDFGHLADKVEQLKGHHTDTKRQWKEQMDENTELDVKQSEDIGLLRENIQQLWEEIGIIQATLRYSYRK